ncbi:hypothetical protein NDU88_000683 [Pleurodeles waltl]|uniref:Uncharacterized protein n=1 Tax=Pleurodeles waltl TaxID=8319 RepID=A0AAV7MIT7_PLEWA|nr:hypothetical protein NDU88_000683 [Pleurodeles waltl]
MTGQHDGVRGPIADRRGPRAWRRRPPTSMKIVSRGTVVGAGTPRNSIGEASPGRSTREKQSAPPERGEDGDQQWISTDGGLPPEIGPSTGRARSGERLSYPEKGRRGTG